MRLIPTYIPILPTLIVLFFFIFPKHGLTFDLDKKWRFSPGDNPEWAKQNFADQNWDIIEVDKPWEQSGYDNYDGFGWYRLRTVLSKKSLNSPYLEFYQKLRLHLGPIADAVLRISMESKLAKPVPFLLIINNLPMFLGFMMCRKN